MNQDSAVDLSDYGMFSLRGRAQPDRGPEGCAPGDINSDLDMDLLDFAAFESAFN